MLRIELPGVGNAFFAGNETSNLLTIETGTALQIIRDYSVLKPDLGMNILGLHTGVQVGPDNKAKWGKFRAARFAARKRDSSCAWNPGGGTKFDVESVDVCGKQHQSEFCVGTLWDSCWEKLLAIGVDANDIEATAEGSRLLSILIEKEYETIGNDYYDLAYFANHPTIAESETNGYWVENGVDATDWNNYHTMQTQDSCGGIMTVAESLKTDEGFDHFNVEISTSDVNGKTFTGDAIALLRTVISKRTADFKTWSKSRFDSPIARPIISVTEGIFNRYKEQLTAQFNGIPQGYQLLVGGEGGIQMPMADVLMFDGYWVVNRTDWATLDAMTGMTSHIVMMTAPGVLGIAYDVSPMAQYRGMGLVVNQWNAAPYLGKTFFHTNYKVGAAILDHKYVVYGSLYLAPTV